MAFNPPEGECMRIFIHFPRKLFLTMIAVLIWFPLSAQEGGMPVEESRNSPEVPPPPRNEPFLKLIPRYELGYAAILFHDYQSGTDGTRFNFLTQGGQDTLFPYQRFTLEAVLDTRHVISFVYQPLTLNTRTVADRNNSNGGNPVIIDGVSFTSGTPLDITYGFDFWRASYLYDFDPSPETILGLGMSLQIRNASLVFTSGDGSQRAVQQNIGPVPILKARAAHWFHPLFGLDFEVDGFYASSAFFNGSGRPFKGWIWDSVISAKTRFLPGSTGFLALRSIGGGAEGTNAYTYVSSTTSSGSFTWNNLGTLALTLGFTLE